MKNIDNSTLPLFLNFASPRKYYDLPVTAKPIGGNDADEVDITDFPIVSFLNERTRYLLKNKIRIVVRDSNFYLKQKIDEKSQENEFIEHIDQTTLRYIQERALIGFSAHETLKFTHNTLSSLSSKSYNQHDLNQWFKSTKQSTLFTPKVQGHMNESLKYDAEAFYWKIDPPFLDYYEYGSGEKGVYFEISKFSNRIQNSSLVEHWQAPDGFAGTFSFHDILHGTPEIEKLIKVSELAKVENLTKFGTDVKLTDLYPRGSALHLRMAASYINAFINLSIWRRMNVMNTLDTDEFLLEAANIRTLIEHIASGEYAETRATLGVFFDFFTRYYHDEFKIAFNENYENKGLLDQLGVARGIGQLRQIESAFQGYLHFLALPKAAPSRNKTINKDDFDAAMEGLDRFEAKLPEPSAPTTSYLKGN